MKVILHEMSWIEAEESLTESDVVIIPVGSNEQHGPQNPLGTDHLIAKSIAEETAKKAGVTCLQVVPFGVSSHHKQFWGTIFVSSNVFKDYVKDVCLSLSYYGVKKIVIVNGHGGNLCALMEMARELRDLGIFISVFQWWNAANRLLPDLFKSGEKGHAAAMETSVNLALHPDIVNMSVAVDEETHKHAVKTEGVTLPLSTIDETSSGVFGVSTTASAEKGAEVFEAVVDKLVEHVNLLKESGVKSLMQKPRA